MSKSAVLTARVTEDTLSSLDRVAAYLDRSRSWIVKRAVERYVAEESKFFAFIEEGEAAIARGDTLTQEQMEEWVKTLGATPTDE